MGIASFVISLVAWALMFVLIITVGVSIRVSQILPLSIFIAAQLVAMGLGIGGLFQNKKKKTFAKLGTLLSLSSIAFIFLWWNASRGYR